MNSPPHERLSRTVLAFWLTLPIFVSAADPIDDSGRNGPLQGPRQVSRAMLDESLSVGRQFLLLNQTSAGNFHYEYDFTTKRLTPSDSQVRQAGATWGIATIHRESPTDETHAALAHAFQFFWDNSVLTDDGRRYIHYPNDRVGRTGTVALVTLALVEFVQTIPEGGERVRWIEMLNEYTRFLVSLRQSVGQNKGRFWGTYDLETGKGIGSPSPYFDGEALLALTKVCRYGGMTNLKDKIVESADVMHQTYAIDARKVMLDSNLTKGFYQWGSLAFHEIHAAKWASNDRHARWTIDLADWMIDVHQTLLRRKNTAYAYEGLISAWELARDLGMTDAQARIGQVIEKGLLKLTSWQVGGPNPNAYLRKHPTRDPLALGGVMNSENRPTLRIDVAQHQMHALILARRYIYKSSMKHASRLPFVATSPKMGIWSTLGPPLTISSGEAEQCMNEIWDALQQEVPTSVDLPEMLRRDDQLRCVFITVGDNASTARVVIGSGRGLASAITEAIGEANSINLDRNKRRFVRLDLVETVGASELLWPDGSARLTLGRDGFLLISKNPVAVHPWEVVSQGLIDDRNQLQVPNLDLYVGSYQGKRGEVAGGLSTPRLIRPFRTTAYFHDGQRFEHLFRGHRLPASITRQLLLGSLQKAGTYLTRSVKDDGRMTYEYNAATAEEPNAYNILRHAGTTFAMFDLYSTTKDEELLTAAQCAREYLLEQVVPWKKDGVDAAAIGFNKKLKLGGAALTLLALIQEIHSTGIKEHLPLAQKLARYIGLQQREDGSFISQRWVSNGRPREFDSVYYPGEAILALIRLHGVDNNPEWLDMAQEGARYLIQDRDKGLDTRELPHDHWLLYALDELHRKRPHPMYVEHARRIIASMAMQQRRTLSPPDHLGSFYDPPRTTPTAARAEGMIAAAKLFESVGDFEETQRTLEMVHLATSFQLQTQFLDETSMLVDDPARCIGAFHQSLTHFEIRNDYVQHNISALLELHRLMCRKNLEVFGEAAWESTKLIERARHGMVRANDELPAVNRRASTLSFP